MDEIGWFSLEVLGPDEFWDALLELTHRTRGLGPAKRLVDASWARPSTGCGRRRERAAAMGRLMEVGKGWWRAIIDRGQVLGVIRTDLPQDLLVEIVMGADQGGDRWMMEHWDEFSEEELKRIVDAEWISSGTCWTRRMKDGNDEAGPGA